MKRTRLLVGKAKQPRRLFKTGKSVVVAIVRRETGFPPEIKAYTAVLATGCLCFDTVFVAISLCCSGNTLLVQIQFKILFLHANNFRVTTALRLNTVRSRARQIIGENEAYRVSKSEAALPFP